MNGRTYDPKLGRMLQADPFVQSPKDSQSLNRYTYVNNNPLSLTDPTGYFSFSRLWKKIRPFVSIAIAIWNPGALFLNGVWAASATGFLAGYVAAGSLRGAVIGAFSAAAFYGVGQHFAQVARANPKVLRFVGKSGLTPGQYAGKGLAHGLVGGVMNELSNGKFGHGFLAAGATQLASVGIDGLDRGNGGFSPARVAAAAAVGGTASDLTGGKFANGAVTGAFSRAFNDELEHFRSRRFEDALEYQIGRVAQQRRFNLSERNSYSGSNIGSYIYFDAQSGHYTLEAFINPNQADPSAGAPFPGLFSGTYSEVPENVAALVIAEKPYSDPFLMGRSGYYQQFSASLNSPLFVVPWTYRLGDQVWRFDSSSCSFYPSGNACK